MCITQLISYPCCGAVAAQTLEPCTEHRTNPAHTCPLTLAFDYTLRETAECPDCRLQRWKREEGFRAQRAGWQVVVFDDEAEGLVRMVRMVSLREDEEENGEGIEGREAEAERVKEEKGEKEKVNVVLSGVDGDGDVVMKESA